MPVYFFDIFTDSTHVSPGEAVELVSHEFAQEYALGIVSTFPLLAVNGTPTHVIIRDEAGTPLGEVRRDNLAEG